MGYQKSQSFQAINLKLCTRYYKHIEDVHVTFCTQKYNFDKITAILTDISDISFQYRLNVLESKG